MNSAQVRAKARSAIKRREEAIEQEELEGGEINLVPYLDIVTNLMLFMLASVAAGFILGQINTTLPKHAPAGAVAPTKPDVKPDEQPLGLVVSVTKRRLLVWSVSNLEGNLKEPAIDLPVMSKTSKTGAPRFEYQKLNDKLYEIAGRRWKGKDRPCDTYDVILQADVDIPYETVIDLMDALRRRIPPGHDIKKELPEVTYPCVKKDEKAKPLPSEPFDPDKHHLFPDILFGKPSFD